MDLIAKLTPAAVERRALTRDGAALPTAVFVVAAAALLTASVHWMTRADIRTTTNRESAARALTIAEAGLSHALAIMRDTLGELSYTEFLRGPDTTNATTSDDGYLIGRTLSSGANGNDIPVAGRTYAGGRYEVQILDDPAETDADPTRDSNARVLVRCTGFGPDGARADVDALVGGITMPGFVFDGPLTVSGSPSTIGRCGGAHANGAITVGGTLMTNGPVSSTSTVTGLVVNTGGTPVTPLQNQPPAQMPDMQLAEKCQRARYWMRADGTVFDRTLGTTIGTAISSAVLGFKRASTAPLKWTWEPTGTTDGSFCFDGNLEISGGPGSPAAPLRWSIYTSGSLSLSGNPYLQSFDEDSVLFGVNGDVVISGNPIGGGVSYGGAIYARYQCRVSGNPRINGQLLCDNEPSQPASSIEYASFNEINGNPTLTYNCNNKYASTRRFIGWLQRQGTP